MISKLATLSIAAVLSAGLVSAQGMGRRNVGGTPPDPQAMIEMRVNSLATVLNLTDAQKTKATAIFSDARTAIQPVQENLRSTRESLQAAVTKNDTGSIDTLAATVGTLTGQLIAIQSKSDAALYAMLTPDQQAKYDALPHGRQRPGGPGMGPGGPGGPGGWGPQGR